MTKTSQHSSITSIILSAKANNSASDNSTLPIVNGKNVHFIMNKIIMPIIATRETALTIKLYFSCD